MMLQPQPLYKLNPPHLNGYVLDLEKSQKQNAHRLQQHSHAVERKLFFERNKSNFFLKKFAKWEWILFAFALLFLIPLWQLYVENMRTETTGIVLFHLPLSILLTKYICIELFIGYKASQSTYAKDLQQFYTQNWLEIRLFPYLEKICGKIDEIKSILSQLSQQHLKTLTFTETPNIHSDLLSQTKEQLNHIEQVIAANKNALYTFESLEKELFMLKQSKDQEKLLFESMQKIPNQQAQKLQKEGYIKRFKQLKQFTVKAHAHYHLCNTQPQEAVQKYGQLMPQITTYT